MNVFKKFVVKSLCRIRTVSLDVTDRCNMMCKKCLLQHIEELPDMTMRDFEVLLKQLPETVKSIVWAGMGEPLLNPHTKDMIQKANLLQYETILYTNGTIPHAKIKQYLTQIIYNCETVISKNIIEPIATINYVTSDHPEKLQTLIKHHRNIKIMITPHRQMYPGIEMPRTQFKKFSPNNVEAVHEPPFSWRNCLCPWTHINVSHNLHITPCCIHQHPSFFSLGQIGRDGTLMEIWRGKTYSQLRRSLSSGSPNKLCSMCGE